MRRLGLRLSWMNRNVRVLLAARVAMSAARALAAVVVPIYLAVIGFTAVELGELFLVVGLAAAVLSSLSGLVSDRVGRRPFLVVMPLLATVAAVAYAVTSATVVLFVGAALGSFGRGAGAGAGAVGPYQAVESAVLTQSTPPGRRNAAFGWVYSGSSVGALGGGLLATLAGSGHVVRAVALAAYRPAFFAAAALAAVAGLLGLAVQEPKAADAAAAGTSSSAAAPADGQPTTSAGTGRVPPAHHGGRSWRFRFPRRSRPLLLRLWATNSVTGLAGGMFAPFITYWFYRRFHVGPTQVGDLYAIINAATVGCGLFAAPTARRVGLVRTIWMARGLQAVSLIPMVLAPAFWIAGLFYLLRMAVQRTQMPLRQSFVLSAADPDELASVAALSRLPAQVAMSGGPVAAGYLFDEVSLSLPFLLASGLMIVNAFLYWLFFRSTVPAEERTAAWTDDEIVPSIVRDTGHASQDGSISPTETASGGGGSYPMPHRDTSGNQR